MESPELRHVQVVIALGRGRHRGLAAEQDNYYLNMSELWAFHHFTPSLLETADNVRHPSALVPQVVQEVIEIFLAQPENKLGILWSEHADYNSHKYTYGTVHISQLLSVMRTNGVK